MSAPDPRPQVDVDCETCGAHVGHVRITLLPQDDPTAPSVEAVLASAPSPVWGGRRIPSGLEVDQAAALHEACLLWPCPRCHQPVGWSLAVLWRTYDAAVAAWWSDSRNRRRTTQRVPTLRAPRFR
jgi:hypothetical protein